jgi:hypothetical protein
MRRFRIRRLCIDQRREPARSKISFAHFTSSLSADCTQRALSKSQKASNEKHNHNNTNDIKHIILLSFA